MPTPLIHNLKLAIGFLLILIAGSALVGWMLGYPWLTSWRTSPEPGMDIPASCCFLLCGLFIFIQAHNWIKASR